MLFPFFSPKEQEFIHGTTWVNLKCILPSERSQNGSLHSGKGKTLQRWKTDQPVIARDSGREKDQLGYEQGTCRTMKLFCELLQWELHGTVHSQKPIELYHLSHQCRHGYPRLSRVRPGFNSMTGGDFFGISLVDQMVKNLPAMQETWVQSLGREDPLEKGMATHSSIHA